MDAVSMAAFSEIEALARAGAVAIVKVDGGRLLAGNPDIYTVVLSGRLGQAEFFHCDGSDLALLIRKALDFYGSSGHE